MTEKELKKLNRYQLLEIIIMQTEELQKLTSQLEETKALLEKQQINVASAGNIAQASLQLSGVFEAAQTAADRYLEAVKEYSTKADTIIADAQAQAQLIISAAEAKAAEIQAEAQKAAENNTSTQTGQNE